LYQHIVYDEYLEAVFGSRNVRDYLGRYRGYKPNVDGSTGLTFITAAMRVGHSNVKNAIRMFDGCGVPRPDLAMNGTIYSAGTGSVIYADPSIKAATPGETLGLSRGWSNIVQSSIFEKAETSDVFIVDALANIPIVSNFATGIDVVTSNLRRGRIHSTPNYNTLRQNYYPAAGRLIYGSAGCDASETSPGPDPLPCFLKFVDSVTTATAMRDHYGKVNKVDAYTGMLVESHASSDSNFGLTATALVLDQFKRSRDGDRFYWENLPNSLLSNATRQEIKHSSFQELISRHTNVLSINANGFQVPKRPANECNGP
jgi:hypothetical protein